MSIAGVDGVVHNTCAGIEGAFLDYYKSPLGTSLPTKPVHSPTVRTGKLVTDDHRNILLAAVTPAEIKECMFAISSTKSPGPDGYNSQFFKDSWEIVEEDVTLAIQDFFPELMLVALHFPQKFIELVMTCVSSPSYSLAVNGNNFGFFQGRRGLRQGDPLSPLFFTICMEYLSRILGVVAQQDGFKFHPMCGHIKLNHFLFADDLLLFCKGTDISIMWLLRAFYTFSAASGLQLNRSKSDIYFNGGALPFKYLGVPISSKKLTKNEGLKLTERIVARIRGWWAKHVSYAGRVTLVNAVLANLHSYWATIFLIPSCIMNKINAICKNFLWSGKSDYSKVPNIGWDTCCYPKEEGGLGIKDIKKWNKALLGKYVWWLANKKDHLWVRWVNHVYMKGTNWFDYMAPSDCSWPWKKITYIMHTYKQAYTTNLWLNAHAPYTVAAGYEWLLVKKPKVSWWFLCWNSLNIPKCLFIFWKFMHQRLPTRDRLARMGLAVEKIFPICLLANESHGHLVYDCVYAKTYTSLLQNSLHTVFTLQDLVCWFSAGRRISKMRKRYVGACHEALIYWIWRIRNEARLDHFVGRPELIVHQILQDVKTRFLKQNFTIMGARDKNWFHSL
ncbi:uncharacterized protein LOC141601525 [Silene latifolia]|uniref:uncharacterized protein LOC141601525 n=1 Tax=Silene latifolia TaxID=37657 RepID=UPI003D76F77B